MVTVLQARCLDEVVRSSSFRAAALRLHLAQPSVSGHVANLERELGVRLLDRSTRGVQLTPEGERLLPLIRKLLAAERALTEEASALRGRRTMRVRIISVRVGIAQVLPRAISWLRNVHPEAEVEVHQGATEDIPAAIRSGEYDLGLTAYPGKQWPGDPLITAHPLGNDPLGVCAPIGHPLLRGGTVGPTALRDLPLILVGRGTAIRELTDTVVAPRPEQIVCTVGDADSAIRLVDANVGVAVVPPGFPAQSRSRLGWVPLTGNHVITLAVLHERDGPATSGARELLDRLLLTAGVQEVPHA